MNRSIVISILVLFGINSNVLIAQKKVESGTYNAMLNTVLSHSVDEVGVSDITGPEHSKDWVFLDARESEEFEVSHIQDAIHVGYEAFDSLKVQHLDRTTPLIVYCSIGYRSEKIAERLISMGFTDVQNLYGGIFEWVNQENGLVNDKGATDTVHAYSRTWGIWLKDGEKVYD